MDGPTPPEQCSTMEEVRAEIDALDAELIALLVRRAGYIDRATALKSALGWPANIPARVEEVLAKVRAEAEAQGLSPALAEDIWTRLIGWSIDREAEHIARD